MLVQYEEHGHALWRFLLVLMVVIIVLVLKSLTNVLVNLFFPSGGVFYALDVCDICDHKSSRGILAEKLVDAADGIDDTILPLEIPHLQPYLIAVNIEYFNCKITSYGCYIFVVEAVRNKSID